MKMFYAFFSLCLVCFTSLLIANDQSYIEEESLCLRAFYYDAFDGELLPAATFKEQFPTTYFLLDLDRLKGEKLVFDAVEGLSVFVNGSLRAKYNKSKHVEWFLRDFVNDDKTQVLVFFRDKGYSTHSVRLISQLENLVDNKKTVVKYPLLPIELEQRSEVFVFFSVVFLVFAYFRFISSDYLYAYFDLTKMFSRRGVDEFILLNPFTIHSCLLFLASSMLFALGIVENSLVSFQFLTGDYIFRVILIGFVLFLLVFVKYGYLYFLNITYGQLKFFKIHFFEYARIYGLASVLFFTLSFGAPFIVSSITGALGLFWLLWLVMVLIQKSKYTKVYLISYLCVSEIFPILIVFKLAGIF